MGKLAAFFGVVLFLMIIIVLFYLFTRSYTLEGVFYADDELNILHNDELVYTSKNEWNQKHQVKIDKVAPDDKITFQVKNLGGPGGLIGYFRWKDQLFIINKEMFQNTHVPEDLTPWRTIDLTGFPASAQWIWSNDKCLTCNNKFDWIAKA